MDATLIGGKRNQAYVARGALDRSAARFASAGFFASLGLNFFLVAALAYVGSLPREKPVIITQHDNGAYTSFTENATPSDAGTTLLLGHWFAACRIGSNDPHSMSAQQCAALIPGTGDVKQSVADNNQAIADSRATVSPNIRSIRGVTGAPYEYEIDADETVSTGQTHEVRSLVAYVTIAYDDARANLHDPVLNPFGVYVQKLQITQMGTRK